jgi:peptidoglycan/LPS O-acetylase OafA/YrhL
MPDESTTGKHIPALDGLRGIAIALVLMHHLLVSNNNPAGGRLLHFFVRLHQAGWIGVDLFFVLSGFLITGVLYDTRHSGRFFRNFYARRALRIFPLYYGVLVVVSAAVFLTGCRWYAGIWAYATYTISMFQRGVWYCTCSWVNINHFWSLSIEELFYAVWPAAVYWLRTPRRIVWLAVVGAAFSLALRYWFVLHGDTVRNPYLVYSYAPARMDSLLAGATLAIVLRTRFRVAALRAAPYVLVAGGAVIVASWMKNPGLDWQASMFLATGFVTILALTFCALIALSLERGVWRWIFERATLRFLGRYSYGLYVYHYILEGPLDMPMRDRLYGWSGSHLVSVLGTGTLLFALTLAVSMASFHLYEKPWLLLKYKFQDRTGDRKLDQVAAAAARIA